MYPWPRVGSFPTLGPLPRIPHLRRAVLARLRWDGQDTPIQELLLFGMAPAGSSPSTLSSEPGQTRIALRTPPEGAARVVAGTRISSGPSQLFSTGRSASQVVATLSSIPRGSQVTKPHLLGVAVQNPNRMHRLCSNDQAYRRKCLKNRAIRP